MLVLPIAYPRSPCCPTYHQNTLMCLIVSFSCVWRSLLIFSITFYVKFLDFSRLFIGEAITRTFSVWIDDLSGEAGRLFWKIPSPVIVEVSSMNTHSLVVSEWILWLIADNTSFILDSTLFQRIEAINGNSSSSSNSSSNSSIMSSHVVLLLFPWNCLAFLSLLDFFRHVLS